MKRTAAKSSFTRRAEQLPGNHSLKPLARSIAAWTQRPAAWSLLAGALPALAAAQMPTGGTVVAGSATITTPNANNTVIQQSSDRAILNWQGFSVGSSGYVQFIQPGRNAVALNRVVGSDPSSILGHLSSNGQIFLVNPNGVYFGAGAVVDVAGIVATTMDIRDADFMRGDYRFSRSPLTPEGATVINAGTIGANGGYVVLAGDYAANKGVIQAQLGTTLLAAGDTLTLQMAGSSLVNYAVDKATVAHLAGVENSGQILANGGRVVMTADVANDLAATVVNNSGLIQAQSRVEKDGAVYLAGQGGNVVNSGTVDASAQAGANGGHVEMRASGDLVHEAGSMVNVSGADTGVSNAGSVDTWADGTNRFNAGAAIVGTGGKEGGDGGMVELSGNKVVNRSLVDLRAPKGRIGKLLLDPTAITIADGAGADAGDQSTVYEQNVEAQLRLSDYQLSATGPDASITLANLSDGVLDGTNGGNGGSLTLTASGTGNPAINFANTANTIKVDGGLTLNVNDGEGGNAIGSMNIGNLQAGTSIDLKAGSIQTGNLTINKSISTSTDTSYGIGAHAYSGDLKVNGDVALNVVNDTAAAVATDVHLAASGDVNVTGAVSVNATGKGYHNYNWVTKAQSGEEVDGQAATTYLGEQPWEMQSQADHPITTNLDIQAGGKVAIGSTIDVLATDTNTSFTGNNTGGYWQTATATQHNFWRSTAAQATAAVNAGGDVTVGGKIAVNADGYATAQYSETETWRTMVDNFNYTTGHQTVHTDYGCLGMTDGVCTGGYGYRSSYDYAANNMKGSPTGNYIWVFGPYTYSLPSDSNNSPTSYQTSDSDPGSGGTAMSYTGARGLSATLDINAGGSVTLNGMSVLATNRSGTGGGSFTDANWGNQDTAGGLNNTASSFTSSSRETDYYDTFSTGFTASTATATTHITAGDNQSVALQGGEGVAYDVIASHPNLSASSNTLATAGMTVTAGAAGGASGTGQVTLDGPIHVEGADDASITLAVVNHDGDIKQAADNAAIVVKNNYSGHDAKASFTSDIGNVTIDDVAVNAGRNAYVDATANQNLDVTGAVSAVANSLARIDLAATNGTLRTSGAVDGDGLIDTSGALGSMQATANGGQAIVNMAGKAGVTANSSVTASGSSLASIDIGSSANAVTTNGALSATASSTSGSATVALNGAGNVTVNNAVTAQATNSGAEIFPPFYINTGGTSQITVGSTNGDIALKGNLNANAHRSAVVNVTAGNGSLSLDAGKQIGATTSSTGQNSYLSYVSDINLTGATGMTVDGSVTASAAKGNATVDLLTTGGTTADVVQGSGSTVLATGKMAGVTVNAGNAAPNASNAAALALGGDIQARGTSSAASIAINGKSGSINNFSAISTGNAATVTVNAYDGDLTVAGNDAANGPDAVRAALNASASLNATGGTLTLGDATHAIRATTTGTGNSASLTAAGSAGLNANGALSATGNLGTATIDLSSSSGNLSLANDVTASGNTGATVSATATTGTLDQTAGTVLASTATGTAATTVTSGDAMTLDGTLASRATNGTANTSVSTTGDNASVTQASTGTIKAAGRNSAVVNLTGTGAMTIDGAIVAAATNDGTTAGTHTGSALADIGTTGGSTASITQGSAGTVTAVGTQARVSVTAGDSNPSDNIAQAAAFNLGGSVQVIDAIGGSTLDISGASGSVHDFSVTAGSAPAAATITAYNGDLTLDGTGNVSGNYDSATGASLTATASGNLDASAATLAANNNNTGSSAGAKAVLTANNGTAQLGSTSVGTVGNGDAALTAMSSGDLSTPGMLAATGNAGTATIGLTSSSGNVNLASDVTATGNNSATVSATATTGTLNQTAGTILATTTTGTAAATVTSGDAMTLDGTVSTRAINGTANTSVSTTGDNASVTQGSTGTIKAAANDSAVVDVSSTGAMTIDGSIVAAATNDGTTTGMHTGSALINIGTTGGNTASITQGGAGTVTAVGAQTRVKVTAGDSNPSDNIAQAAAFNLGGTLQAIDDIGGSTLDISGASGSVHNFSVTAGSAPATATITAYNGDLTLDGTGNVSGNDDSATGARLTATASGNVNASAATLAVSNNNTGSSAGAKVILTADNGTAQLGNTSVSTAGNGDAALTAMSSGDLSTAGTLAATGNAGTATIGLTSSSGNVNLANDVTTTGSNGATVSATATTGSLNQTTGTASAASVNGPAAATFNSAGAMTVNGNVSTSAANGTANTTVATTGGNAASITQGANSVLQAVGGTGSTVTVLAGTNAIEDMNGTNAAALDLHGALHAGFDGDQTSAAAADVVVAGKSGTVGNFAAHSDGGAANAGITAFNGNLTLNGTGDVNASSDAGAAGLTVNANNGNLTVIGNTSVGAAGNATANLTATGGSLVLGDASHAIGVTTANDGSSATVTAAGTAGVTVNGALSATGGNAGIDLSSSGGNIALNKNVTALGNGANVDVTASNGSLTQATGTTVRAGATGGSASVDFTSNGAMTVNGTIVAAATNDGTITGAHHGFASVGLTTTGGSNAGITQGSAGNVTAVGSAARVKVVAGRSDSANPAASFNLAGAVNAIDTIGGATLDISGASGSVHDFAVSANNTSARATITTYGGNLVLNGTGTVSGNADNSHGAELTVTSAGAIDSRNANLAVTNGNSGESAKATATLAANGGSAQLGQVSVTGKGAGDVAIGATALTTMTLAGNLTATGLGLGDDAGAARISLATTGTGAAASTITQNAGTTISAATGGNAGDATVDIQAGNCCNSAVTLNGAVAAVVTGGSGDASVAVRGNQVSVQNVKANAGNGNALVDIAAPAAITVNGTLNVQATNTAKRADVRLISDRLTYNGGNPTLSYGNSHVQLASFNTTNLIGVDSDRDFDATVQTNYALATLQKFMGSQAEITFGGKYDRSAWTSGTPATACLPGMNAWVSTEQQIGNIHVAGNGALNLGDVKMVFDTTGTTYYHDNHMSPWSVPSGRVAIFVTRPNIDRYLDRTDNALQAMNRVLENRPNNAANAPGAAGPTPNATLIHGNLFMEGDGVNTGGQTVKIDGDVKQPQGPGNGNAVGGQQDASDRERKDSASL